jgi:hypothetical protein
MAGAQIKAGCFTILFFGGVLWFVLGKPGLSEMKSFIPELPLSTEKVAKPNTTKGTRSNKSYAGTSPGKVIDQYKGVKVYFNGSVGHVSGRNRTADGYNLGLKYQCVEFSKRYYYERFGHKMPDSYGHAKDFFDTRIPDGAINRARGMRQYRNGGLRKPQSEDLIVIGPTPENSYGHLMVVTEASDSEISFIQQNPGPHNPSRGTYRLIQRDGGWYIDGRGILGWLRMP